MSVRAVLFDLDDTLSDFTAASRASTAEVVAAEPAFTAAGLEAVQAENLRLLDEIHVEVATGRRTLESGRIERWSRLLAHFGGDPRRGEEFARLARAAQRRAERAVDGAVEVLDALASLGLRLAIVSNNEAAEQQGKLERLRIERYFRVVVVSADHGVSKPDPRLFRVALDRLQVAAHESVYVGDSWHGDVLGAKAAGIRPVWLNRFGRPPGSEVPVRMIAGFRPHAVAMHAILGDDDGPSPAANATMRRSHPERAP